MLFNIRAMKFFVTYKTFQTCVILPSRILMLKLNAYCLKNIKHSNILTFLMGVGFNNQEKKDNLAVVNKAKSCPQLWQQKQTSIAIIGAEFGL